jgi:acetolactate synthase regulatory subunit
MPAPDTDRLAALVLVRARPDALLRVLSTCHRRGWTPTALTWATDGTHGEAALRLSSPRGRCSAASVAAHLRGLVDVLDVVCDDDARLPDDVALAALRTRAPWRVATPGVLVAV